MPSAWEALGITRERQEGNRGKPRIAICVPHTGNWNAEWTEKTYGPLRFIPLDWCDKIPFLCRVPSLPLARTILVESTLQANADYVFFLDTDVIIEGDPNQALRMLYECMQGTDDVSIVSGLYRAKQKGGFNNAMWMKTEGGYAPIREWSGNFLTVDVCGLGLSLIKTEVFKKSPKPWFHWEESDGISEDFFFMEKCHSYGFKTFVFTEVKASHVGSLKVQNSGEVGTLDV